MNCWENSVRVRCLCQSPEQDSACRFLAWRGILPPTEQRRLQSGPPWCSPCRKRPHPRVHPIHRKCQQWSFARSNLRKDDSNSYTLSLISWKCRMLYISWNETSISGRAKVTIFANRTTFTTLFRTSITHGAPDDEVSARIDVILRFVVQVLIWDDLLDNLRHDLVPEHR